VGGEGTSGVVNEAVKVTVYGRWTSYTYMKWN
jgi:hypothetical protein